MPFTQRIGSRFVPHRSAVRFTPTDIAGLQLWLKADAGLWQDAAMTTPAVSDGDVVGAWADQSGNGNNATQAVTANKPLLKLAIVNGKPVVRFDGVDDTVAGNFPNVNTATLFVVGSKSSPSATTAAWFWLGEGATYRLLLYYEARIIIAPPGGFSGGSVDPFPMAIMTVAADGTNVSWRFNEVFQEQRLNGTIGTVTNYSLGDWSNYELTGDIAEILVYDSALGSADVDLVEAYLNSCYAIY